MEDGTAAGALRRRRLVLVVLLAVVVALGAAVAAYLTARDGRGPAPAAEPAGPGWLGWLGLGLELVGFVLVIGGGLRIWRGRRSAPSWRAPLQGLSGTEQRGLLQQVRGRSAVQPDALPLTRQVADALVRQQGQLGMSATGLALLMVGQVLVRPGALVLTLAGTVLALLVVGVVLVRRDARAGRRFLRQHG